MIERDCSIHELVNSSKEARLLEMFGAATHCPLQPISRVVFRDTTMLLNVLTGGEIGQKLGALMDGVMRGSASHEWITAFE